MILETVCRLFLLNKVVKAQVYLILADTHPMAYYRIAKNVSVETKVDFLCPSCGKEHSQRVWVNVGYDSQPDDGVWVEGEATCPENPQDRIMLILDNNIDNEALEESYL